MPQHYIVDFKKLEPYEVGAVLLTLLAHPQEGTDQQRSVLHASLCSQVLQERARSDQDWANTPQLIKPVYAFQSEADIKASTKKLARLMRDRAVAGRKAMAFFQEAENGGQRPSTLPENTEVTLDSLAVMVKDEVMDSDSHETENIEKRIWRPSLPIIHLAAALQVLMQGLNKGVQGLPAMDSLWTSRDAIIWLVKQALYYEELITSKPIKRKGNVLIKPEQLIKIRLA
jgi:hypothetical protein